LYYHTAAFQKYERLEDENLKNKIKGGEQKAVGNAPAIIVMTKLVQ